MAERWQQWMPFHIDRWKGSAHVQAMRAVSRAGYLYLLSAMWQTSDCTLPDDADDLLVLSGLAPDEWEQCSRVILKRFTLTDGKWSNSVLFNEWSTAKRVFESRQASAQRTNTVRTSHAHRDGHRHAELTHEQEQKHIQVQKKKPSRGKREGDKQVDPRHALFLAEFRRVYEERHGVEPPWNGQEAKMLSNLLAATPRMTLEHWEQIIKHRFASEDASGEALSSWVKDAQRWYKSPLDRFGKPLGGSNGSYQQDRTHKPSRQDVIDAETRASWARLTSDGVGASAASQNGDAEAWGASEGASAGLVRSADRHSWG